MEKTKNKDNIVQKDNCTNKKIENENNIVQKDNCTKEKNRK